jgi:hypothetical protein
MRQLTSLVFSEFVRLRELELIGVGLCIAAVGFLQHAGEASGPCVNGAPRGHSLDGVDLGSNILQMSLAKGPYLLALSRPLVNVKSRGERMAALP